jgi:hypothetical protein
MDFLFLFFLLVTFYYKHKRSNVKNFLHMKSHQSTAVGHTSDVGAGLAYYAEAGTFAPVVALVGEVASGFVLKSHRYSCGVEVEAALLAALPEAELLTQWRGILASASPLFEPHLLPVYVSGMFAFQASWHVCDRA